MATAIQSNADLINSLMGVTSKLFGSNSSVVSSGGIQTTQNNISQAGVDAMLKSLMEGTTGRPGLTQVSQGQRNAGLYNTNVRSMTVNDLIARSTAEVEKARTGSTTVTKEPTIQRTITPGMVKGGAGSALLTAAALAAGSKKGRAFLKEQYKTLTDTIGSPISTVGDAGSFGDAGILGTMSDWTGASTVGDTASFGNADVLGSMADWGLGADTASFATDGVLGSMADWGFTDTAAMTDFGGSMADFGYGAADVAGSAGEASGVPYLGAGMKVASGDTQGGIESGIGYAVGSYFGGPIGGSIGSAIAEPVFEAASDFVQSVGDMVSDCFITTAICQTYGKPDDCDELMTLRAYRDSYLQAEHPEDIATYYEIAPAIVASIDSRSDAPVIWADLYKHYIVPAIQHIEAGENELAYSVYKEMVFVASELAGT